MTIVQMMALRAWANSVLKGSVEDEQKAWEEMRKAVSK